MDPVSLTFQPGLQNFCGEFGVFVGETFNGLAPLAPRAVRVALTCGLRVDRAALSTKMQKLTAMHAIFHARRVFSIATSAKHG